VLPHDYPELDFELMDIHLIENGDRLLGAMTEKSSADAQKALEKMGVHLHLQTLVTGFDGTHVNTNSELGLKATTVIWAAGIKGNVPEGFDGSVIARGNRLKVDAYNRLVGSDHIFAVGDLAYMETEDWPQGHPQVAPTAMQMGTHLGENFKRLSTGAPLKPFQYLDKGSMATIGRNKAVLDFGKLHLKGILAWLGWMFVHIFYLIGFRNKAVVFVNWVWSYFTYDKGTRLIIRPFKRKKPMIEQEKELEGV
jgi:NADH dehydrogenase